MTTTSNLIQHSGHHLRVDDGHRPASRTRTYASQTRVAILVAFALSAAYTLYISANGTADASFDASAPAAWVFYATGFGLAAVARSTRRGVVWALATVLTALIAVALFYYPSTFTVAQQTTFGWFENDVYTGLLMVALYLTVQRLRGSVLVPAADPAGSDGAIRR